MVAVLAAASLASFAYTSETRVLEISSETCLHVRSKAVTGAGCKAAVEVDMTSVGPRGKIDARAAAEAMATRSAMVDDVFARD